MMKKLVSVSLLAIVMSLASCSHMGHHGCSNSGKQCEMKKEKCGDCKGKDSAQCDMKKPATEEVKK